MKYQLIFRDISKTIGIIVLCFTLLSCFFVLGYVLVDFKSYVRNYKIAQSHEIDAIKLKTNLTINQLEKTLRLIESRIYAARGDVTRIQQILNSVHKLQNAQQLPEIQKISFYKLSPPQMTITRFGILPLDPNQLLADIKFFKKWNFLTNVDKGNLVDRLLVMGVDEGLEGMLEVQIPLNEFWKYLGTYRTVYFNDDFLKHGRQSQPTRLFPVHTKPLPTLSSYIKEHYLIYRSLGFYLLFSVFLLGICIYSLAAGFYRIYEKRVTKLEEGITNSEKREKQLNEDLEIVQRRLDNHSASCQLRRKFQSKIKSKQVEYANDLVESLNTCQGTLKDNYSSMTYTEFIELLEACKHQYLNLSLGLWEPTSGEKIDLVEIINNISTLFIEKIEASNIAFQLKKVPQTVTTYEGDSLFTELFLINAIGKRLYLVPKNGKMFIYITKEKVGINIEIQDNCYGYTRRNHNDLFIEDVTFQQLCLENNITYLTTKNKNGGMNVTHIMFPYPQTGPRNNNVVQLFK